MDDAVVITDDEDTVVYLNDEAESVFDVTVTEVVGDPISALIDADTVDFDAPDAMAETDVDDRTYEVRSSEIVDRHGRDLGYAIVCNDITKRKRREVALEQQRDRLQTLERLNAVIRGVNRQLVTADSREAATEAVRESLTRSELYDAVWVADETVASASPIDAAGERVTDGGPVEVAFDSAQDAVDQFDDAGVDVDAVAVGGEGDAPVPDEEPGRCVSVPVVYGKTVYGALVLFTTRTDAFSARELAVLDELGESLGHAINAAAKERLLVADAVIELEFDVSGADSVLTTTSTAADCQLEVAGTVAGDAGDIVAYVRAEGADVDAVCSTLAESDDVTDVRVVSEGDATVLECTLTGSSILFPLREYGATLESLRADSGDGTVAVTVSPDADVRTVVERVEHDYPGASLAAKRRRDARTDAAPAPAPFTEDLTDRQQETLEAAYAAGYFEWPRDSTAEEVADSMGISAPTLHSHLRKAQNRVLRAVLEDAEG
jgi:predicted DNA binding protein